MDEGSLSGPEESGNCSHNGFSLRIFCAKPARFLVHIARQRFGKSFLAGENQIPKIALGSVQRIRMKNRFFENEASIGTLNRIKYRTPESGKKVDLVPSREIFYDVEAKLLERPS